MRAKSRGGSYLCRTWSVIRPKNASYRYDSDRNQAVPNGKRQRTGTIRNEMGQKRPRTGTIRNEMEGCVGVGVGVGRCLVLAVMCVPLRVCVRVCGGGGDVCVCVRVCV